MTTQALSPRRAMLAQAAALQAHLTQEFGELPGLEAIALTFCEHSGLLKLDFLEKSIDMLKAEVLSAARLAERHAFNGDIKRPRGYRRPRVPAFLDRLLDPEDAALATSDQVLANLEGVLYVLDFVCAVHLRQVSLRSLVAQGPVRPLLLREGDDLLAWVLAPEGLDDKKTKATCLKVAQHVRKYDSSLFRSRLYLSELARQGFQVLSAHPDSLDITSAA